MSKVDKDNFSIEHFHNSKISNSLLKGLSEERIAHLNKIFEEKFIDGEILEFGVYKGTTINLLAENFKNNIIYGFDSFEGLPEPWITKEKEKNKRPETIKHKKGFFSLDSLPLVKDNVSLVKGFFEKSLPTWIQNNNIEQIKLLHIDSDLYSSAKTIFDNLNDFIVPGTIIIFDEFYPWGRKRYETWEENEFKALKEWVEKFDRSFEVLYHNNHWQCSIKIIE